MLQDPPWGQSAMKALSWAQKRWCGGLLELMRPAVFVVPSPTYWPQSTVSFSCTQEKVKRARSLQKPEYIADGQSWVITQLPEASGSLMRLPEPGPI